MAAISISAAGLGVLPASTSSFATGDEQGMLSVLLAGRVSVASQGRKPIRSCPMMGNVNEGKGVFAPLVAITRDVIGKKRFNKLRGKAIAVHSQVITEFCKSVGADGKQRQGLIRLAKKNGEKLGFLA